MKRENPGALPQAVVGVAPLALQYYELNGMFDLIR